VPPSVPALSTFGTVLTLIALSGLGSLLGGVLLLLRAHRFATVLHLAHAFAAGVLLATVFLDLVPEALALAGEAGAPGYDTLLMLVLAGLVLFGLLEWLSRTHPSSTPQVHDKPTVPLIVIGDSVHNLADGAAVAATFLADPALGLLTAVAVAAHEIPQEIADFGILLSLGISARRVLLVNGLSALTAIAGGLLVLVLGALAEQVMPALLALVSGFFLYLVWHLLRNLGRKALAANAAAFTLGLALLLLLGRVIDAVDLH
jgi:zinc and cadmium transporter